jgi:hypothetical protein
MSDRKYGGEIVNQILLNIIRSFFLRESKHLDNKKKMVKKEQIFSNSKVDYENVCREEYRRNVLTSKGKSSINKFINRFLLLG